MYRLHRLVAPFSLFLSFFFTTLLSLLTPTTARVPQKDTGLSICRAGRPYCDYIDFDHETTTVPCHDITRATKITIWEGTVCYMTAEKNCTMELGVRSVQPLRDGMGSTVTVGTKELKHPGIRDAKGRELPLMSMTCFLVPEGRPADS